jgi:hypothetical protein
LDDDAAARWLKRNEGKRQEGRPRLEGVPRTSSGQLSRSREAQPVADAARQAKIEAELPELVRIRLQKQKRGGYSPEWSTYLGALAAAGAITDAEYRAGLRFRDWRARGLYEPVPEASYVWPDALKERALAIFKAVIHQDRWTGNADGRELLLLKCILQRQMLKDRSDQLEHQEEAAKKECLAPPRPVSLTNTAPGRAAERLSDARQKQAVSLLLEGNTVRGVAEHTGLSKSKVGRLSDQLKSEIRQPR